MTASNAENYRCGRVALAGRPNVGKSTLLNRLVGQKIAITARRPQTTRHRIAGIHTRDDAQIVYLDCPGLHVAPQSGRSQGRALNRYLNRTARGAVLDADVAVMLVEAGRWTDEDESALGVISQSHAMVVLAINKIDRIAHKDALLPYIAQCSERHAFVEVVPISAKHGANVAAFEDALVRRLPISPPVFAADAVTDRSERFMAAEFVREQLTRRLGAELPYRLSVSVEGFERSKRKKGPARAGSKPRRDIVRIAATIWVERASHKPIVIGRAGEQLKQIGSDARKQIEIMVDAQVHLELWVKVLGGWSDDARALARLGLAEF